MKSSIILTKAEKREQKRLKAKNAPQGGTLSGQILKMKTNRGYAKRRKRN